MKTVYLLRSVANPEKTYIGRTGNFSKRLLQHNAGDSRYTERWTPWAKVVTIEFEDDAKASAFEEYLKSGSGHAFAKRHF